MLESGGSQFWYCVFSNHEVQQKPRNPLTLDIYPSNQKITRFALLEDDGLTYKFKTDIMYNKTLIECEPRKEKAVNIKIVGLYEGNGYDGMPEKRNYHLQVHGPKSHTVTIDGIRLTERKDTAALEQTVDGWYFDQGNNISHI